MEASTETQAAERALRDAGGPSRASSSVSKRVKVARSALLLARSEYAAARETVLAAERAVEKAEVALANSAAERNIMNLLFKRKLTPEEEEEQRVLLEESRRLKAVVTMQRNFRKAREIRRAATRVAERRRKMRLAAEHALKSVASAFLVYFALILLGRCLVALVGARHAFGAAVSDASSRAFAGARSLAPLEHGYVRYGLASKLEAGENHVLRERNRALGERVSALELELRAATDALEVTHSLSPCAACSRDRELRAEAEERARTAEARSAALGTEVHALRALSTRFGASERDVQKASRSSSAVSRAWLDDPGVSFSAQVAAAATAAATVTLEARVSESTAARHAAEAEAEATRVEIEVLRSLIDEGFLPGGAGGKCWAEVADAKARAQVAAARVAGERAQSAAAFAVREKLDAYQSARSEAERRADEYRVELEALRALPPELRGVADDAEAGNAEEANVRSPYAPRTRKTVVGAAKLVAAAKVASERVAQAAEALRGAETRAEVRRVELETLRTLVAGNGTAGVVDRAETAVFELPGAASRAHEAAERRVASRLRAEEEARARAETRAEVFRVELAAQRALEAERAAAAANASEGFFGAGKAQPGVFSRSGEVATLTKEVRRLEAELERALKSGGASPGAPEATPEAAAHAAAAASIAAADAAAEAAAAKDSRRERAPLPRRVAAWIVAGVLGESPATRDALKRRIASLEKRLVAVQRAVADVGPGPACASALTDALDARRRAESDAASLALELESARDVTLAVSRDAEARAIPGEAGALAGLRAGEALIAASDKHRKFLTEERRAAKAALESCRGHAAAAATRAFGAAAAAADASHLFERHKLKVAAEALEAARMRAMDEALETAADASPAASPSPALELADVSSALAAVTEAEARSSALSDKLREAERRFKLAPGSLDAYAPAEYSAGDAYLIALGAFGVAVALTVAVHARSIPLMLAAHARFLSEKARVAWMRKGLREAQYEAEVQRDLAKAARVEVNEAHAAAARHRYVGFDDGRELGTVVDEMRANVRKTSEVNDALRADNDWLRAKLAETREAQAAFLQTPVGGWGKLRTVGERESAELALLRAEVERLRAARLDASATAAAAVRADARKHPEANANLGALKLGSPSFRTGMAAAREAAEREAQALRVEAEALREAHDRALSETARLREANRDLMEDLGEADDPRSSARDAARRLRAEMDAVDEAAEAVAAEVAAERVARLNLTSRNAALVREAKRERAVQSKVFFCGACVSGAYALASGASRGKVAGDPSALDFGDAGDFSAAIGTGFAALVAACLGAWALAFTLPSRAVRELALPIEEVVLLDEDDVERRGGWPGDSEEKRAEKARRASRRPLDFKDPRFAAEGGRPEAALSAPPGSTDPSGALVPSSGSPTGSSPAGPSALAVAAALELKTSADGSGAEGDSPDAAATEAAARRKPFPGEEIPFSELVLAPTPQPRSSKRPIADEDPDEMAVDAAREAEIAALREQLSKAQEDADRLRASRGRLSRRAEGMRMENDALASAAEEVRSRAETMSLSRSSGATARSEAGKTREQAAREESLRRQLANLRSVNARLEGELSALRGASEDAVAEAEAASAEASLYSDAGGSDAGSDRSGGPSIAKVPPRPRPKVSFDPEFFGAGPGGLAPVDETASASGSPASAAALEAASLRATRAEAALAPALERAARAESALPAALANAAQAEARATRAEAAAAASEAEAEKLRRARDALAKEIEWLKQSRERLLREVATLRSANGALERDLKLGEENARRFETDLKNSYGVASDLEKNLAEATARADAATEANRLLERDLRLNNERAEAAIAAAEQAALSTFSDQAGAVGSDPLSNPVEATVLRAELEAALASKDALEVETRALRVVAEAANESAEETRMSEAATTARWEATRARNAELVKELAVAREDLLAAREQAQESQGAKQLAARLKLEVDALSDKVKEAFTREAELRRQLTAVAKKALEKSQHAAAGSSASGQPPSGQGGGKPPPAPKIVAQAVSAFARATPERRYAAKRRALDVLVSAAKPTSEMRADPRGSASKWKTARKSLVAISRQMSRPSAAFVAFERGALATSLALMAASPKDRAVQVAGCRVVASLVTAPALVAHAKKTPSFAGGAALRAAANALQVHVADATAARAAARALWTAVHLGGKPSQDEMVETKLYEKALEAMRAHAKDGSVLEACVGSILATALGNEAAQDALDRAGVRAEVRRVMRERSARGSGMRFGGAFAALKEWLRGGGGSPGVAKGVTSKALGGL